MPGDDFPYKTVLEFRAENGGLSKEAFVRKHPSAFLIVGIPIPIEEDVEFQTFSPATAGQKSTRVMATGQENPPRHTRTEQCVYALSKPEGEYRMITIGRTSNNDVHIPHTQISKFHAYFKKDSGSGKLVLTDAGSTNGTQVNLTTLTPRKAHTLSDGDKIVFGKEVRGVFHSNESMWTQISGS